MSKVEKIVIGVMNSNEEIIELLSIALELAGYKTVPSHLRTFRRDPLHYPKFIRRHKIKVLIIDVPPPYEENWGYAKKLQDVDVSGSLGFVFTTTNKQKLEELVGPTETIEIIGKPFDLEEVVEAVNRELKKKMGKNLIEQKVFQKMD